MKKRTYKAMKNRMYREVKRLTKESEARRIEMAEKLLWEMRRSSAYKDRLLKIGTNMKTVEPEAGAVVCRKWEVKPESWGKYMLLSNKMDMDTLKKCIEVYKKQLVESIARSLIEEDLIQFMVSGQSDANPLHGFGTIAAKLNVVPWEQMPHKGTIELFETEDGRIMERENAEND